MRRISYWALLAFILSVPGLKVLLPGILGSVNRMLGLTALLVWAASVVLLRRRVRTLHLFHLAFLGFILWNVIGLAWTPDIANGMENVQRYLQSFAISIVIWDLLTRPEDIEGAMQAYVLGALVSIVSTVYDYLFTVSRFALEFNRFAAAGFDPNDLGLQLMIAIPFSLHLFMSGRRGKLLRLLNGLYPLAAIVAVILSGSRGALIAGVPAFLLLLRMIVRVRRSSLILLAIMTIGAAVALAQVDLSTSLERFASIGSAAETDRFSGRLDLWEEGIRTFFAHPFLGIGTSAFGWDVLAVGHAQKVAHNLYLSVLTELGVIGFLLFAGVLAVVIASILGQPKNIRTCWLISFLVWAIGVFSLTWEYVPQTWLLFALSVSARYAGAENQH